MSRIRIKPVRVVIVDDHEEVRVGLRTILSQHDDIKVVGEASTAKDAISEASRLNPNMVLMDVRLANGSGIEACRAIRESCPDTRVLLQSSYEDEAAVRAAVMAGASGYLLKQVNGKGLVRAKGFEEFGALRHGQRCVHSGRVSTACIPLLRGRWFRD